MIPAPQPPLPTRNPKPVISKPAALNLGACQWAREWPEVQKACYLARICEDNPPRKCQYRNIAAIPQNGPTCGLTALIMLLDGQTTPQEMLIAAKQRGYTNNGEMFSAQQLFQLVHEYLETTTPAMTSADTRCCTLHEGYLNCAKVKECLLAGDCLFVPYPFQ